MESVNHEIIVAFIKNAQKGKDVFEQLIKSYQHHVIRLIRALTQNHSDAEDLAQETWIKVYQAIGKLKPPYHLDKWIFRIAQNTVKDWLRSRQHKSSRVTDEIKPRQLQDSALRVYQQHQLIERIRDAIDCLSPKNRQVVYDFYISGNSAAQISQRLKVPVSTVNSRLKEARKQLRKEFSTMPTESFPSG